MIGASREVSPVKIRWSKPADTAALAALHRDAWRYAYRGIIPGISLERMIARHGPAGWERMHRSGLRALVLEFDNRVAGYATFGPCRTRSLAQRGEIYELYVRPEFQGIGFGKRLFGEARRHLSARRLGGLLVWSLTDNDLACRFYGALGGRNTLVFFGKDGVLRSGANRLVPSSA